MKFGPLFSLMRLQLLCAAALLLSACGNRFEVKRANDAYQQALALGDVQGQRRALLLLTRADDGVSDYWIELAKIDLQLGLYGDAYAHFSRAHELDRTAVMPLSMMTELAVINGRVDVAEDHLKDLLVIAPNDRAVSVARGFTALRQGNFAEAQKNVDALLAQSERDSVASILQTRLMVAQKKFPEAIAFLNRKIMLNPKDGALLRSLSAIQRFLGDWSKASDPDLKLWQLSEASSIPAAERVVSDALRANNVGLAKQVTEHVMLNSNNRDQVAGLLSAWADFGRGASPPAVTGGREFPDHSKIAFAQYLNDVGRPDEALAILGANPRPLDDRANGDFNAVFAQSMMLKGQLQPARRILDRLLSNEPDDAVALSARAMLFSKIGDHRAALIDAQRLVASYDTVAKYRVLLAQTYKASQDGRGAERTLWDGYRDLPGDETLYNAVQQVLAARKDGDGLARLKEEYDAERFSRLMKELA